MGKLKIKNLRIFLLSAVIWLTLDLLIKYLIVIYGSEPVILIKDVFSLSVHSNYGVALGIRLGYFFQLIISSVILFCLIFFGFRYLLTEKRNIFLNQALLGIIVGGAIGNLLNRLFLGYVIDYIAISPFPIFNFADIGITVGLLTLFILTYEKSAK